MERALGFLLLIALPLAAVINFFRAVGFYLERIGRITLYGVLLLFLGRKGADMVISMEVKRLKKQSIELWSKKERFTLLKEEIR